MSRYRRAAFTVNNWTNDDVKQLLNLSYQYLIYAEEKGQNGTPHLQGYIEFKGQEYFTALTRLVPRAHWERAKKCAKANIAYCKKDGNFKEYGEPKSQGKKKIFEAVRDDILDGASSKDIFESYPSVYIKNKNNIDAIIDDYDAPKMEVKEFRCWQTKLIEELKNVPDARKIIWYIDIKGGSGKSFLAKWLYCNMNAACFSNAKTKDIACAYRKQRIAVFDFSRSNEEYGINYSAIEQIKNGFIFSTKYKSKMIVCDRPHVVCFINFMPELSKLSHDRWDLRFLELKKEPKTEWVVTDIKGKVLRL